MYFLSIKEFSTNLYNTVHVGGMVVWLSARWTFGPTFIDREIGRSVVQGRGEERVTSLRTSACEARLPYRYLANTTKKRGNV